MVSGSWFVTRASNANAPTSEGPGYGDHDDDYHYWERHSDAFDARGSLESSDSSEAAEETGTRWARRSTGLSLRRETSGNCACVSRIRVRETRA